MVLIAIRSCSANTNDKHGNKLNIIHWPMPDLKTILGIKDPPIKIEGWGG